MECWPPGIPPRVSANILVPRTTNFSLPTLGQALAERQYTRAKRSGPRNSTLGSCLTREQYMRDAQTRSACIGERTHLGVSHWCCFEFSKFLISSFWALFVSRFLNLNLTVVRKIRLASLHPLLPTV
jgi:hypothetical protein